MVEALLVIRAFAAAGLSLADVIGLYDVIKDLPLEVWKDKRGTALQQQAERGAASGCAAGPDPDCNAPAPPSAPP